MSESLATGAGGVSTDDPTGLFTAWTALQAIGVNGDYGALQDPNHELFDVLRGWPLEGALSDFGVWDPNETIVRGMFVTDSAAGYIPAVTPDLSSALPIRIMCALDGVTSTTVIESGKLPVLTTNYVVRTDQIAAGVVVGDLIPGTALTVGLVTAGLLDVATANDQVIGYVRAAKVTTTGSNPSATALTVDIEVN